MRTIAICDDEPRHLQNIHEAAQSFLTSRSLSDVEIRDFPDAGDFLCYLGQDKRVDVALLDICMGEITGIDVARKLREKGGGTQIIFLTTSKEFAVDAFSVNAAHYLVKPFTQAQFDDAMLRVSEALTEAAVPKQIQINEKGEISTIVDISDINYIESIGHHRYVHTKHGEFTETHRTLSEFLRTLEELLPGQFIAPYRGYVINLASVRTITPRSIVMKDGANILIKPGDFRTLKSQLFAFTFG